MTWYDSLSLNSVTVVIFVLGVLVGYLVGYRNGYFKGGE